MLSRSITPRSLTCGIMFGTGSVIADRQRALFEAFTSDTPDAKLQRALPADMSLLVETFYGAPYVDWQARMKQVLHHFGRFASANVLGPLQTIPDADWQRIQSLLDKTGLSAETLYSR